MDYARLPSMVQFALSDVEAHAHLARAEEASRMWRTVAAELRELSDSLRHELECLAPNWNDATGAEFARQVTRRRAAVDELLARVTEHRPWQALDDLARQLLLTRTRLTGTAERPTGEGDHEAAAHLGELDRYFLAAAEAVLGAAGGDARTGHVAVPGCCSGEPGGTPPRLAGAPAAVPAGALGAPGGTPLPPGGVSIPGLVAVPPGSPRGGGGRTRRGTGGGPDDSRAPAGGGFDASSGGPGGSTLPDAAGSDVPRRIEQAADPVPLTTSRATPEAPQPPAPPNGAEPASSSRGTGRMIPPMMMMPPMMGGAARNGQRSRTARSLEDSERHPRTPQATPGVPPRLRGRSAVADPAGSGYRPVAMSGTRSSPEQETLDHEVWQVANPGAATPLQPEPAEQEPPRRVRRPRV